MALLALVDHVEGTVAAFIQRLLGLGLSAHPLQPAAQGGDRAGVARVLAAAAKMAPPTMILRLESAADGAGGGGPF